jgi:UDP-3-O-[3-hydroxymyristoyl] N-acetylglucosamine deacetylase/3-hydroxyacyl-[acyl-carrier-protein] dehydratase
VGEQFYEFTLAPGAFEEEIAPARTFGFMRDLPMMNELGLGSGGRLDNCILVGEDGVINTELRFPDEFVRHKILDIVGDLSLLGRPLRGHLIAVKPGHATNCELVRRILAQMRKPLVAAQAFAPPPGSVKAAPLPETSSDELKAQNGAMDIQGVMQLLPHRYPFLMVDRVAKLEGNHIVGIKNVTVNESYFQGHFPGHPVMPGVLQLEAIAQVAGIVMLKSAEDANKLAYFMSAEDVKWRKPVLPGDVLVSDVELTKMRGKIGKAKGVCKVGGEVVSEAAVTFMLIEP